MQRLLTKGIKHERFKKTEIGKIPEEWKVVRLDNVSDVIDPWPSHRAPKIVENGIPYVGIGDIKEDGTILVDQCRKVSKKVGDEQEGLFRDWDIGFGRVGTVGKVVWLRKQPFKYALSPTMAIVKPHINVDRQYIFYVLQSYCVKKQIQLLITGSTRPSLGITRLRTIKIPLPPFEEQKKIAEILMTVDKKLELLRKRKEKLERIKKGLMKDLLTGRRRVKA